MVKAETQLWIGKDSALSVGFQTYGGRYDLDAKRQNAEWFTIQVEQNLVIAGKLSPGDVLCFDLGVAQMLTRINLRGVHQRIDKPDITKDDQLKLAIVDLRSWRDFHAAAEVFSVGYGDGTDRSLTEVAAIGFDLNAAIFVTSQTFHRVQKKSRPAHPLPLFRHQLIHKAADTAARNIQKVLFARFFLMIDEGETADINQTDIIGATAFECFGKHEPAMKVIACAARPYGK